MRDSGGFETRSFRRLPDRGHDWCLILDKVASDLGGSAGQDELFERAGRRLLELGLETLILTLTRDGAALRPAFSAIADFNNPFLRPAGAPPEAPRPRRRYFDLQLDADIESPLTSVLHQGGLRRVDSMMPDLEALLPANRPDRWAIMQIFPFKPAVYAPITAGGRIAGVLVVLSAELRAADEVPIQTLATLISAMLESVRRLESERRRRDELTIINRVAVEINTTPPSLRELARSAETALAHESRFERARLALIEGDMLVFPAAGVDEEPGEPLDGTGSLARVARAGEPFLANELRPDRAGWDPAVSDGARSLLIVPLLAGPEEEQVAGVIAVESSCPDAFDENDIAMLETVASNLVTAVRNVRLFERTDRQLVRKVAELEALVQVGRVVTESLDSEEVLFRLVRAATQAFGAEYGALALIDDAGEALEIAQASGPRRDELMGQRRPLADPDTEARLRGGDAVCISERIDPEERRRLADQWVGAGEQVPRSLLIAPLARNGQLIGALSLVDKERGSFAEDDVDLARWVSLWATSALENAQLYAESQEKEAALQRGLAQLGEALTCQPELRRRLDTVLSLAIDYAGADAAAVELLTPDGKALQPYLTRNMTPVEPSIPVAGSLVGRAVTSGKVVSSGDATRDLRVLRRNQHARAGVRSVAAAPLRGWAGPLGVLTVYRSEERPFRPAELDLLLSVADQAAVAIEQERAPAEARRQSAFLSEVVDEMHAILLVVNDSGQIEWGNARAREAFTEDGGVAGQHLVGLLRGPEQRVYFRTAWAATLAGSDEPFVVEVNRRGGAPAALELHPWPLGGGRYALLGFDVTEERTLERLRYRFLRHLHHEVRGPLGSALGFLQLLREKEEVPEETRRRWLEHALNAGERFKTMLDELRLYSLLLEPAAPGRSASLGQVVQSAVADARGCYPGLRFEQQVPAALPRIALAQGSLARAIRHLLDQAAKLSPRGSCLNISAEANRRFVYLIVTDQACGTDKAGAERLEALEQNAERGEWNDQGIGLGLALLRRALRAGGGELEVESQEAGNLFRMRLPAEEQE